MTAEDAIKHLDALIVELRAILARPPHERDTKKWGHDAKAVLDRVFGSDSRELSDFGGIRYVPMMMFGDTPQYVFDEAKEAGLKSALAMLESFKGQVERFGLKGDTDANRASPAAIDLEGITVSHLLSSIGRLTAGSIAVLVTVGGLLFEGGRRIGGIHSAREVAALRDTLESAQASEAALRRELAAKDSSRASGRPTQVDTSGSATARRDR